MNFRNSLCYRMENNQSFKYIILGPLGTNLVFLSPLGLLRFQDFISFLSVLQLSYSKPFYSTLNYASTANIQEVMKFHNLGNKSFETDKYVCIYPCYKHLKL